MQSQRARQPESTTRQVGRSRPITGSIAAPRLAREPQRGAASSAGDARVRRSSSLPKKLLVGRLIRGGALLGVASLAALGVVQVAHWVERTDALPIRTIAVRATACEGCAPSTHVVPDAEILAYAAIEQGAPLFAVDINAVAARVSEHPYVAAAAVRRAPPDGIEISYELRAPSAVLVADRLYLVDPAGRVMKTARPGDGLDLPVITGISAAELASGEALPTVAAAVSLAVAHANAGSPGGKASEVNLIPGVGFELVLEDGARVRVGDDGPEVIGAKLSRLDAVVRRLSLEGRRASFIYLDDERRPERAAVRLRPEAETPPAGG